MSKKRARRKADCKWLDTYSGSSDGLGLAGLGLAQRAEDVGRLIEAVEDVVWVGSCHAGGLDYVVAAAPDAVRLQVGGVCCSHTSKVEEADTGVGDCHSGPLRRQHGEARGSEDIVDVRAVARAQPDR